MHKSVLSSTGLKPPTFAPFSDIDLSTFWLPAENAAVAQQCYTGLMATTTVRLSPTEEELLDELASSYGGRSNAIRQAILLLASRVQRQRALEELLASWEEESGCADDKEVEAVADLYDL